MKGEGVWADLIKQRAEKAIRRFGMEKRGSRFRQLDASQFKRPLVVPAVGAKAKAAAAAGQMDLF